MRILLVATVVLACAAQGWAADTLVYDPSGGGYTEGVLTNLGITYDLRSSSEPVTAADLASHSLLVVSCNDYGSASGLSASVLATGITGRIVLTGHDADVAGLYYGNTAAVQLIVQSMAFARRGGGTGMVCFADLSVYNAYLPAAWGVTGQYDEANAATITAAGAASGVYNGLTSADMSNWNDSYYESFTAWGSKFKVLETGASGEAITIATPEPATLSLVLLGGLGLLARRRKTRQPRA
jgi:hypothetical protein